MTNDEIDDVLTSWHSMNKALPNLEEADLKTAISRELTGCRRKDVAVRLHQRYTVVRAKRERAELIEAVTDIPEFLVGTP
jgi:HSP20 family molecular chaperone IbpA